MKKVTLKDIAKELNVTVGTVSHVLNGIDDISEDTKKRVLETADKMGYIANGPAVSLRLGKTRTVSIIIPDISNPHIAHQVKLIEDKLKLSGYSVVIFNTNESDSEEKKAILASLSRQVDGIMLCPTQHNLKNISFLMKTEIPFILIGRYFEKIDTDYVCADDFKSGYLAGRYLLENGYSSPMYIGAYKHIEGSANRLCGLRKAFMESGLEIPQSSIISISPKADDFEEAILKIKENINTDSLVVFSDIIAFKIMSEIKNTALKSLPVVGFDAISSHLKLPFDYVSIGMINNGWAEKATEILLDKINGETKITKELVDVKIFVF